MAGTHERGDQSVRARARRGHQGATLAREGTRGTFRARVGTSALPPGHPPLHPSPLAPIVPMTHPAPKFVGT
jgi:hypothetical protein